MSSPLMYSENGKGKQWDVRLRSDSSLVAIIYKQQRNREYRYRLMNYSHRMSKVHKDIPACLAAIEREVL